MVMIIVVNYSTYNPPTYHCLQVNCVDAPNALAEHPHKLGSFAKTRTTCRVVACTQECPKPLTLQAKPPKDLEAKPKSQNEEEPSSVFGSSAATAQRFVASAAGMNLSKRPVRARRKYLSQGDYRVERLTALVVPIVSIVVPILV